MLRKIVLGAVVLLSTLGCVSPDRGAQIRTFAQLQTISRWIETDENARISASRIEELVLKSYGGKDYWENEILFDVREAAGGYTEYLLVSTGSDGRLDVSNIVEYYTAEREVIRGQTARDIVFRNGKFVTDAGHH